MSFTNAIPDKDGDKLRAIKEALELRIQEVGQISKVAGELNLFVGGPRTSQTGRIMIDTSGAMADGADES